MRYVFPFLLSITLMGCSENRVLIDETTQKGEIFYHDSKPFDGVIYDVHNNGKIKLESEISEGLKNGLEKIWYEDGILREESIYIDGRKDGMSKVIFKRRIVIEGSYKNGVEDGEFFYYLLKDYPSKKILVGYRKWKDGVQDGVEIFFEDNGNLRQRLYWENGEVLRNQQFNTQDNGDNTLGMNGRIDNNYDISWDYNMDFLEGKTLVNNNLRWKLEDGWNIDSVKYYTPNFKESYSIYE
jgi:hypothetical protein